MSKEDAVYLRTVLDPIRLCAQYKPKFGQGAKAGGLTLEQFQALYRGDPFYRWFGLDDPLMYAAHKAAGGMTSVYRQIGIGCEKLFRTILKDSFQLSATDVAWSYEVPLANGKKRILRLDGRIPLDKVMDLAKRERFRDWMRHSATAAGVNPSVFNSLRGAVFEVRQGYKSKDSKRQNADIANAGAAYAGAYFPCAMILSTQIDGDILLRYRAERWSILTGIIGADNSVISTYDFMRDVVGYDLAAFFRRNRRKLRTEIEAVFKALLVGAST